MKKGNICWVVMLVKKNIDGVGAWFGKGLKKGACGVAKGLELEVKGICRVAACREGEVKCGICSLVA